MPSARGLLALLLLLALSWPLPRAWYAGPSGPPVIPITGDEDRRLVSFDRLMRDYLTRNPQVPGAALAVARNGKLVYSRGFGHADPERRRSVQPDALFRIASLSKPLTATAVVQLAERGKLHLDAPVFTVLGLREPDGKPFDPRWRKVTLRHLLHHTGGWDRDSSGDPMFRSPAICAELGVEPPARPGDVVRYALARPLDFEPGSRYCYSNFGYCLLGRVIEKVSGVSYEEYLSHEVLAPVGGTSFRLGRSLLEQRLPGEVWYDTGDARAAAVVGPNRGSPVPPAYGSWCQETLDSHGGWVASAPDLVRFAVAFDHPERCKILNAASIATLFARPPGAAGQDGGRPRVVYYACGWNVRPVGKGGRHTWHSGSLPGTSALLVRRNDGLTWAVLFNSREHLPKKPEPASEIDGLLHEAADAVREWP